MKANIFVSSTFIDLQGHRSKVREGIRALDHIDMAMEYYVAEPLRPLVRCLNDVQRCDLYVGLFARRYGFIPPGSTQSITEQEYRAAVKHRKDILCFLLSDEIQWPEEFVDSGEPAEKLKKLREEISSNHLAGFFSTPDELATKVSAAIVRTLQVGTTPMDIERENRLFKEWRKGTKRADRVRAGQALFNMGSPRYAAAIKDLLLEAREVEDIARYMDELLTLSVNSRQAMPIFLDLLHVDVDDTRQFAIFQIGELGLRGKEIPIEIVRAITKLQIDQSSTVRAALAHTLGKIHHFKEALPEVRDCLEKLKQDGDSSVRERAEESLALFD
jgi:hypothetical protein